MKSLKVILVLMIVVGLSSTAAFAKDMKVGFVDLSRLFDEFHKTQEYDQTLEQKSRQFEEERNAKIEQIREAQGKLGLLKEDKKAEMEEQIEQLKADLLEYDQQKKADLTKERNEKIRDLLLEIENIVSDHAAQENYSLIFNDRVLIYGDETIDLTDMILEKLNAKK